MTDFQGVVMTSKRVYAAEEGKGSRKARRQLSSGVRMEAFAMRQEVPVTHLRHVSARRPRAYQAISPNLNFTSTKWSQ